MGSRDAGTPHPASDRDRRPARGYAAFFGFAALGALGGTLANRVTSARLTAEAANDLRTIAAGLSISGVLALGLQLTFVAWAGRTGSPGRVSRSVARAYAVLAGALTLAAGGAAIALIDANMVYRVQIAIHIVVAVGASLAAVPARAELLAAERWTRLGLLTAIGPLVKLVTAIGLLSDQRSSWNVLPLTVAEVVTALAAFALRPKPLGRMAMAPPRAFLAKGVAASTGLVVCLALTTIAFRNRLGPGADTFNASGVVARSVVFLPLAVAYVFFPRMASSRLGSADLRRAYHLALWWTGAVALVVCLAVMVAPTQIATLVGARSSEISVSVLRVLALAWTLSSLSIVSLLQHISHGSRLSWTPWAAAVLMLFGHAVAATAWDLALFSLASAVVLLVMVLVPALMRVQPMLHAAEARPVVAPAAPRGDITVVVPCFNPGAVVASTLTEIHVQMTALGMSCTVVAVTDGSTDGSDAVIDELQLPGLVHVRHDRNRGKGAAVRTGFSHAHTQFVAFIDADGDLPPANLVSLLGVQQQTNADIVFGSKINPDSVVHASGLRRTYSSGYQALIRLLFQLDVKDTQTGVKVFRHDVIDTVLPMLREDGFALDLELFISARAAGFTTFVAVPVELRRASGSTISTRSILRMVNDTFRLFWRAKIAFVYSRSATQLPDRAASPRATSKA